MGDKWLGIRIAKKTFKNKWLQEKEGLLNMNLTFESGKTTLIMGTSGAGKSTLIKCLLCRCRYQGSAEFYDGSYKSTSYKKRIAYIPQHPALNDRQTVYETIYWACRFSHIRAKKKDIEKKVKKYIDDVGLRNVQNNIIGTLSGGQRQRVSIAKELVREKEILIADEIDTGLDCGLSHSLINQLKTVTQKENKITIIISHNLSNMDLYDNVAVIVKDSKKWGRVAFMGKIGRLRGFFGVKEYYNILHKLNSKEEHGAGEADFYVSLWERTN